MPRNFFTFVPFGRETIDDIDGLAYGDQEMRTIDLSRLSRTVSLC
jgi:hypothetical protein